MKTKPSLWLMVVMLMFPQIVETIYSPALVQSHNHLLLVTHKPHKLYRYTFRLSQLALSFGE
ncbi:multidrug resistance protein D [Vibrio maritimus]|uniref:Multidrug resistance protein D n=1 Tax=Vibrio maritimus TaxID=990268 RepID=A0A090RNC9_9VIBR|nr:multidrug resistance protein D [Vibrio maritimus]